MLTNQMQKIDEAVERANLVNKLFYFYFFFHIDIFSHWNSPIDYSKIPRQPKS
jgi:hypothetical protein